MMKRISILIFCSWLSLVCYSTAFAQSGGTAGAFARMGFNARGMGMGNSLTAVTTGAISTYYNPALGAFSEQRTAAASFGILSLGRYLNFLSYTQAIKPTAGVSFGLINAGVRDIDGRDNDGVHTEDYSTFENQFYLAFSNRVDPHVSLGVAIKLYYSKLFDKVKSTTVGFDLGALITVTDEVSLGLAIQDINSKYKWDTKEIYGQNGKPTEDKFPNLRRVAVAYKPSTIGGTLSAEVENTSEKTTSFRFGAEYPIIDQFTIRGGIDRIDFSDQATGIKPSFGFTIKNSFNGLSPSVTYAFMFESFAPHGIHLITLSTEF